MIRGGFHLQRVGSVELPGGLHRRRHTGVDLTSHRTPFIADKPSLAVAGHLHAPWGLVFPCEECHRVVRGAPLKGGTPVVVGQFLPEPLLLIVPCPVFPLRQGVGLPSPCRSHRPAITAQLGASMEGDATGTRPDRAGSCPAFLTEPVPGLRPLGAPLAPDGRGTLSLGLDSLGAFPGPTGAKAVPVRRGASAGLWVYPIARHPSPPPTRKGSVEPGRGLFRSGRTHRSRPLPACEKMPGCFESIVELNSPVGVPNHARPPIPETGPSADRRPLLTDSTMSII